MAQALMWAIGSNLNRHPSPVGASTRGFTLVEILVVLVIVGIAVSLATLTLGAGTRPDAAAAHALMSQIATARDLAESSGRATLLRFGKAPLGELLHRDDEGRWQALSQDPAAPSVDFAITRVSIAGVTTPTEVPIVFSPEGVGRGVAITFTAGGTTRTLQLDAANGLALVAAP
jgi:general secretion pathway protein H